LKTTRTYTYVGHIPRIFVVTHTHTQIPNKYCHSPQLPIIPLNGFLKLPREDTDSGTLGQCYLNNYTRTHEDNYQRCKRFPQIWTQTPVLRQAPIR